jgi:hypothetical protein
MSSSSADPAAFRSSSRYGRPDPVCAGVFIITGSACPCFMSATIRCVWAVFPHLVSDSITAPKGVNR